MDRDETMMHQAEATKAALAEIVKAAVTAIRFVPSSIDQQFTLGDGILR